MKTHGLSADSRKGIENPEGADGARCASWRFAGVECLFVERRLQFDLTVEAAPGLREAKDVFLTTLRAMLVILPLSATTKFHGMPPAEADFRRFFRVTPPVVHEMIKTLHSRGFIERELAKARSMRLCLTSKQS
jgi:hypothetical protein